VGEVFIKKRPVEVVKVVDESHYPLFHPGTVFESLALNWNWMYIPCILLVGVKGESGDGGWGEGVRGGFMKERVLEHSL
jgi:hypothetical protein